MLGLRERAGWSEREAPRGRWTRCGRNLGSASSHGGLLYAVNKVRRSSTKLADGDEVAVIPPVSGGAYRLVDGPLDLAA